MKCMLVCLVSVVSAGLAFADGAVLPIEVTPPAFLTTSDTTGDSRCPWVWLDASATDCIHTDADGFVTNWSDRAANHHNATNFVAFSGKPANLGKIEIVNGRPAYQTGGCNSKIDLSFPRCTTIRTVFWVMQTTVGTDRAFLLADGYSESGSSFHRGPDGTFFSSNWAGAGVQNGRFYEDGGHVPAPLTTFAKEGHHAYALRASADLSASNLTYDRAFKRSDLDISGGSAFSEVIVFDRELTDNEFNEVQDYLQRKWFPIESDPSLPSALQPSWDARRSVHVWFDASAADSFVTNATGGVTAWKDRGAIRNDATAYKIGNEQKYGTVGVTNGLPAYLMGDADSRIDLKFEPSTTVGTIFWVMDIAMTNKAFFLGDDVSGCFHRAGARNAGDTRPFMLDSNWASDIARNATWYLDGTNLFEVFSVYPERGHHLYVCCPNKNTLSAGFLSGDRPDSRGFAAENGRNGGRALSELIVFNRLLSEGERAEIVNYLQQKWFPVAENVPDVLSTKDKESAPHIWYDASRWGDLWTDANGGVTNWTDRSVNCNSGHLYTYSDSGITWSSKPAAISTWNDRRVFDMGAKGSRMDLGFTKSQTIRTIFWVMDVMRGSGSVTPFLADDAARDFHRGEPGPNAPVDVAEAFWSSQWAAGCVKSGILREDGHLVRNPTVAVPNEGHHLFFLQTTSNATASHLGGDRHLPDAHTGCTKISEVIVFNRVLSEDEQKSVTDYLWKKWFPGETMHPGFVLIFR